MADSFRERFGEDKFQEVKAAFQMFDQDGNGKIDVEELGGVLRNAGQNPSLKDIKEVIANAEAHKPPEQRDGKIDFDEFLLMVQNTELNDKQTEEEKLRMAFRKFDKNGNGTINATELRHMMQHLGEPLSKEEVDDMLAEADINGDGVVDYEEFVKVLTS